MSLPQNFDEQSDWQLSVVSGVDAGKRFSLANRVHIGRSPDSEIYLTDPKASRHHAFIQRYDDGYYIADLASSNGTYVNGERIQSPTLLNAGDSIVIGDTELFVVGGPELSPREGEETLVAGSPES